MANALLDHSRDSIWEINVREFVAQLRAPAALDFLRQDAKPATMKLGDFVLKAALDQYLMQRIVTGEYRAVYRALVSLFGFTPDDAQGALTAVSEPDGRQRRPGAKAAAR